MTKIKRILADAIDMFIILSVWALLVPIFSPKAYIYPEIVNVLLLILNFMLIYAMFILKDVCIKNKSIGKYFMKIKIINEETKELISKKSLICRNIISFYTFPVNLFTVLLANKSIGDLIIKSAIVRDII